MRIIYTLLLLVFSIGAIGQTIYSESFEGTFPPAGWTLIDNSSTTTWEQNSSIYYVSDSLKSMVYKYDASNAADDWAITQGIALQAGDMIIVSFDQMVGDGFFPEALEITVGTDSTVAAQNTILFSDVNLMNEVFENRRVSFSVTASGTYYFGFHVFSEADQYNLYVDNLEIGYAPAVDILAVNAFPDNQVCSSVFPVVVQLMNVGSDDVSNLPVTYSYGGTTLTETVSFIGSGDTLDYVFSVEADFSADSVYELIIYTEASGDADNENDTVLYSFSVRPQSSPNYIADFNDSVPDVWSSSGPYRSTTHGINGTPGLTTNIYSSNVSDSLTTQTFTNITNVTALSFFYRLVDYSGYPGTATTLSGDDMVQILATMDCGLTWDTIHVIDSSSHTATTNFKKIMIGLEAYQGMDVFFKLRYVWGDGDYYVDIDDFEVYERLDADLEANVVLSTISDDCLGAVTSQIDVVVVNAGSQVWDFSASPVYLTLEVLDSTGTIVGPVTIDTGSINPNEEATFTVDPAFDISAAGTHNLIVYLSSSNDGNASNDSATISITTVLRDTAVFPVDFTGYTGSNLTTVFRGWYEGRTTNLNAAPGTSSWISKTGLGATTNVTAKVNLYSTGKNEWIKSDPFFLDSAFTLSFKAAVTDFGSTTVSAVMGSDDYFAALITGDCGATWDTLEVFDASDSLSISLVTFSYDLSAYQGSSVMFAFFATEGSVDNTEDYDFHLDDIDLQSSIITSLKPALKDGFELYPNPSTGIITLSGLKTNSMVSVMDVQGREVTRMNFNTGKTDLDLSNLERGIYFIRINSDGQAMTKKVILK